MTRQIFKGRVLAAAGPLPGQLTIENLTRWTEIRKGRFSQVLDETVTHLLCTREQFRKKVPRVKDALKRGKRPHVVHYDWFEFSAVSEKRQPEREYSMRNILAKKDAARREAARIEKGKRDGEKFVNTNFYHIYIDREYFPYQIDITRDDETAGELGQRYTLCLWESDAKPHLYWFTAKFLKRKGSSQPNYYRPSACSGKWRREMDLLADFFRIKTGLEWQDRVLGEKTMPSSFFQYSPPRAGKPIGRRLRFEYDKCLELNAQRRGLPWPPVEEQAPVEMAQEADPQAVLALDGDEAEMTSVCGEDNEDAMAREVKLKSTAISECDDKEGSAFICGEEPKEPTSRKADPLDVPDTEDNMEETDVTSIGGKEPDFPAPQEIDEDDGATVQETQEVSELTNLAVSLGDPSSPLSAQPPPPVHSLRREAGAIESFHIPEVPGEEMRSPNLPSGRCSSEVEDLEKEGRFRQVC